MKNCLGKKMLARLIPVAAFTLFTISTAFGTDFVSVSNDGVNLRSGPDTKFSILYELPQHYPLKIMERKGEWLKVSDFENDQGWIYAPLVSDTPYVIVTVSEGNVRSGPGVNFKKVGTVVREVILKQVKREGDWIKFEHPQLSGWIHRKLVWP